MLHVRTTAVSPTITGGKSGTCDICTLSTLGARTPARPCRSVTRRQQGAWRQLLQNRQCAIQRQTPQAIWGTRAISHRVLSSVPHACGRMEIVEVGDKEGKFGEPKTVRVWLPAGHMPRAGPWPTIYLNDGQNVFEDELSFVGVAWRAGIAASELIGSGKIMPCVVVAIDNAGAQRSHEYLPYPPGTGGGVGLKPGFRPEAKDWPGGGVKDYLERVLEEIVPFSQQRYGCSAMPSQRAFGGSSFGGICALCMGMYHPQAFDNLIIESPSFWMAEGKFLDEVVAHPGPWPPRLFMAMGSQEYSGTRGQNRPDVDDFLCHSLGLARDSFVRHGVDDDDIVFWIDDGAVHNEKDWCRRFPTALEHLMPKRA